MAQTNYTPIQLYYSTTASAVPVNTNLASGELAINITDGLLFYKDNAGTVQKIGYKLTPTTAGGTGLTSFTANGVVYASSTSALATGSALVFDGTNFGLGVTPSAWYTSFGTKAFQFAGSGSLFGLDVSSSDRRVAMTNNAFINTSGNSIYLNTGAATQYQQVAGQHQWYNAASGTAGNAISFTQAMTLDASGNLGIGTSSPGYKLDVLGNVNRFAGASVDGIFLSTVAATDISYYGANYYNNNGTEGVNAPGRASWRIATLTAGSPTFSIGYRAASAGAGTFSTPLTIDASGRLGIGNTTPSNYQASANQLVVGLTGNNGITVVSGTTAKGNLFFSDGTNGTEGYRGFLQYDHSLDCMNLGTNALTAATIDTSGNLGIGTSSPAVKLDVAGNATIQNGVLTIGKDTVYDAFINTPESMYFNVDSDGNSTGNRFVWGTDRAGTTGGTEWMRIDSSGNLLVGTTTGSNHYIAKAVAEGSDILGVISTTTNLQTAYFMGVSSAGENAAASAIGVRKNSSTSRSINAAGTINASGADYAEYMTKAGDFTIAKGDVVGIDAQGKLTNVFADAVSFVVKSTDPSYVGGDTWGSVDVLGQRPNEDATQEVKDAFNAALEAARQTVDRIAFAGQVPVNVTGATAGQYIIPVNDNGAIKGEAVSNPTFEQYQISVGKVIAIESDGRAKIIVKVA